jgi:nucleotide-binding universal stress UspA family protein
MYRKILVPLDGSTLAEYTLAHAIHMAKTYPVELLLLKVVEEVEEFGVVDEPSKVTEHRLIPETIAEFEEQARRYLDKLVKIIEKQGIKVTTDVQYGEPAECIITSATLSNCDAIVMSSHGSSGVKKWTHGSVAEKVFRASPIPLLMVPVAYCKDVKSESLELY